MIEPAMQVLSPLVSRRIPTGKLYAIIWSSAAYADGPSQRTGSLKNSIFTELGEEQPDKM